MPCHNLSLCKRLEKWFVQKTYKVNNNENYGKNHCNHLNGIMCNHSHRFMV